MKGNDVLEKIFYKHRTTAVVPYDLYTMGFHFQECTDWRGWNRGWSNIYSYARICFALRIISYI